VLMLIGSEVKIKKRIMCLIAAIIVIGSSFCIYQNTYIKFQPIVFDGDSYKTPRLKDSVVFYQDLSIALDCNGVEYKQDTDNGLLIRRALAGDRELLLNYTNKALDRAWITSHRE